MSSPVPSNSSLIAWLDSLEDSYKSDQATQMYPFDRASSIRLYSVNLYVLCLEEAISVLSQHDSVSNRMAHLESINRQAGVVLTQHC